MTPNRATAAAWEYHRATNHSPASVSASQHRLDWSNQPRPYKVYPDLPALPLPEPADSTMPALDAIVSAGTTSGAMRGPVLDDLASVLQYSSGITRRLRFPGGLMDFRAAACTGALYHIDAYAVCADVPGLEAGVYQFGPQDRSLRLLRGGDMRAVLIQAAAGDESVAAAPFTLVFTSTYWRNAWKYQARTYRHCFWDAGTIIANALAVTPARGLNVSLLTGFVDGDVNRLLDLDDRREVALALLPFGRGATAPIDPVASIAPLGLITEPYSRSEVDYPLIRDMHAASSLGDAAEVAVWRRSRILTEQQALSAPLIPLRPLEALGRPEAPIEQVIRRRGSARQFDQASISFESLSTLLVEACADVPADYRGSPSAALVQPYLIVRAVDGLDAGSYVYHPHRQALQCLAEGDFTREAWHLDLGQPLAAQAAVDVYLMADLNEALGALGNRGYRAAQLDGAIMGGRLYLAAYALGLGATGLTFYDDDVIEFFSPHASGKSVMFLLALGVPGRQRQA
jgi:SagB-type dehydrogenase family enzyme